jgi:hypothetical protein
MSSQSANTSTVDTVATDGYVSSNKALGPIPLRDSADYTRQIREQIIYNENKANSTVQPGNSENPFHDYANGYRLSYLYGKLKCGSCSGGAFNGNGAYQTNPTNAYGGS